MGYTYDEKLRFELNRIKYDRNSQNQFFGKAVAIQNSPKTYDKRFADSKMAFACDVLCHCNYCNHTMCDECKLTEANRRAKEEIDMELRVPARECITEDKYWVSKSVDKKTGRITITMRPFEARNKEVQ